MKTIKLLTLLFIIPYICFSQRDIKNINVTSRMKYLKAKTSVTSKELTDYFDPTRKFWNMIPVPSALGTIFNKKTPLLIIDGEPASLSIYENLDIHKIEKINILKGKGAALYGIYGEQNGVIEITMKPKEEEYEAIVFDAGFETFLATQKSSSYYSETYLKGKNRAMVTEWNIRHSLPSLYNPDIYEVNIDYNPTIDYGLDVEYTLYMFFCFMEKQNKISLITSNT